MSIAAVVVNVALSLSLMPVLGHVGLATATSVSGFVAAAALSVRLARDGQLELPAAASLLRICLATVVMLVALYLGLSLSPSLHAAVLLALLVAAGGGAYLAAAVAFRAIPAQLVKA